MAKPNNFEEARRASEEMFENGQYSLSDVPPTEDVLPAGSEPTETTTQNTEEPPAAEPGAPESLTQLDQAVQTAEIAAEAATEKDNQLQQAMAELEQLKQQNQQLQGTIDEISQKNAEQVIESALTPPTLDLNGLAFADEETQKAAMAKYAEELSTYNRWQLMQELSPAIDFAKQGMYNAEKANTVAALSQIPELANIQEMMPALDRIIEKNQWLQSKDMPMDERYIAAYAMARGIDSINNPPAPKEPTPEELLEKYNNNPAFQELVEKQRLEAVKKGQQVPPLAASSGAVSAALNIEEKPKTLEEASNLARKKFFGKF